MVWDPWLPLNFVWSKPIPITCLCPLQWKDVKFHCWIQSRSNSSQTPRAVYLSHADTIYCRSITWQIISATYWVHSLNEVLYRVVLICNNHLGARSSGPLGKILNHYEINLAGISVGPIKGKERREERGEYRWFITRFLDGQSDWDENL